MGCGKDMIQAVDSLPKVADLQAQFRGAGG